MIEKMFLWYMFESREWKEKEKGKMFVWFAKAEKWKEENVLITLIPSLIGEVSKRPSRQNCNFERSKKSKNAAAFLHSTFLSISAQFGRIGKSGPGRIWENEILCFLLSSQPNSRNTLPSSSCHSKHIMRGREEKVLGIRQSNQVQRQCFFVFFIF